MTATTRYYYRDLVTDKTRFTRGAFAGWTTGGPLHARYAIFQRKGDTLYVPEYCLVAETRERLPKPDMCRCGTKLADLRDFFGPDLEGHIIPCATCGARQWHAEQDRGECLACGEWSGMDAEGSIAHGNRRTGEREMVRDVDAERERYFASQGW